MKRAAFAHRPFAKALRCTATSEFLAAWAAHLLAGELDEARALMRAFEPLADMEIGERAAVSVDFAREPVYRITLAAADPAQLGEKLQALARGPERASLWLSELGLLSEATSDYDLEFTKRDEIAELAADYQPRCPGSTWEGVLYHPPPTVEAFVAARAALLAWCVATPERREHDVYVLDDEDMEKMAPAGAFARLVDDEDPVFQVDIEGEHPLTAPYGNPFSDAKAWFTTESTELILQDRLVASGDFGVDIENFFRYRNILLQLTAALSAQAIAWGDAADGWPREMAAPVEALHDAKLLWQWFAEGLEACLGGQVMPERVRSQFQAACAVRNIKVESQPL